MTTRCTSAIRAAALMLLMLAIWGMPGALRAQDDVRCACDHVTVTIDPALTCKVNFCYQLSPEGPIFCATHGPGEKFTIPCPVYQAGIILCDGSLLVLLPTGPVISRCTNPFHVTSDCCARVCRGTDGNGCLVLSVEAVPCASDACP